MDDFFHGWQRKMGCVTLLMALTFVGGWVRSFSVGEEFRVTSGYGRCHLLISESGEIQLLGWKDRFPPQSFVSWRTWHSSKPQWSHSVPLEERSIFSLTRLIRFRRLTLITVPTSTVTCTGFVCPYWVIVIPLTLLSGSMLLTKARASKRIVAGEVSNSEHLEP